MMARNAKKKGLLVFGLALVLGSASLACKDNGALENAGEAIDETIDEVTHPNEGPLEKAGRKTSESVEDAID